MISAVRERQLDQKWKAWWPTGASIPCLTCQCTVMFVCTKRNQCCLSSAMMAVKNSKCACTERLAKKKRQNFAPLLIYFCYFQWRHHPDGPCCFALVYPHVLYERNLYGTGIRWRMRLQSCMCLADFMPEKYWNLAYFLCCVTVLKRILDSPGSQ